MKKGRLFVSDGDVLAPSNFLDLMRIGEREGDEARGGKKAMSKRTRELDFSSSLRERDLIGGRWMFLKEEIFLSSRNFEEGGWECLIRGGKILPRAEIS